MSHSVAAPPTPIDVQSACAALARVLSGPTRRRIVAAALEGRDRAGALARLRSGMRARSFRAGSETVALGDAVEALDAATRRDGFHVFLEWHEIAYRFIEDDIPAVLLDAVAGLPGDERSDANALAVLLDYHFLYVLALCATRAWDGGDAAANLDAVTRLLAELQGPSGSGRRFVDDAETLLWIAISTYEPDDLAYHRLLERVQALPPSARLRVARVGAPLLGCHLRWGFPHLYECDLGRMRADNFIDYPWLFFSVAELIGEYDRIVAAAGAGAERIALAGSLLNGLTPDPDAFLGEAPASLAPWAAEHARVRTLLARHRGALIADFAAHAPRPDRYSPLGFHFNFPHNALFAMALLAALGEELPDVSLEGLLGLGRAGASGGGAGALAERLTAFAAANPEPRGSRSVLGLYSDAEAAGAAYRAVVGALEGLS